MSTALKYTLLQVPAAFLVGLLLFFLYREGWLGLGWCLAIMGGWLLKDALLYPFYRRALEGAAPEGVAALVGTTGTCLTPVGHSGLVLVRGEHWQACSATGDIIPQRRRVQVVGYRGRQLMVEPD